MMQLLNLGLLSGSAGLLERMLARMQDCWKLLREDRCGVNMAWAASEQAKGEVRAVHVHARSTRSHIVHINPSSWCSPRQPSIQLHLLPHAAPSVQTCTTHKLRPTSRRSPCQMTWRH